MSKLKKDSIYRNLPPSETVCQQCWKTFTPNHHCRTKFCSKECQKKSAQIKESAQRKSMMEEGTSRTYLKIRFMVLRRDKFACRYCGRSAKDGVTLEIDHVNPESKGGEYKIENLVTACKECNQGKRDILLDAEEVKYILK